MPESMFRAGQRRLRESGAATGFDGLDPDGELPRAVVPDDVVTTRVDASDYVERKVAAMRAHATQITVDAPFYALSNNLGNEIFGVECYRLARGRLGPRDPETGLESDLFAGVA
jgi:N-acetyl-1-D-myo-inositol-2-amino-2-deoxy-alpha-D-glucopyranoside deacetylase